jgi:hypothetical protein
MIRRTLCVHWPEHVRNAEGRQRNGREELGRRLGQIWLIRESLALKLTSGELTRNMALVVLTISQSENLFHPISKPASNSVRCWDTYPKLVWIGIQDVKDQGSLPDRM